MKRRGLFMIAVAIAVVGVGNPGYATTITFGEAGLTPGGGPDQAGVHGTILGNQLAYLGVLFSTDSAGVAYASNNTFTPSGPLTGPMLVVRTIPPRSSPAGTLSVSFVSPSNPVIPWTASGSSISMVISDTEAQPFPRVLVRTFDLGDNMLEQLGLTQLQDTLQFSVGQVHRMEFFDNGADGHVVQNLSFILNEAPIPEPGTFLLLGAGLVALAVVRRQRRLNC